MNQSEPPWFTDRIRECTKTHEKFYKKFKSNGYKAEDKAKMEESKSNLSDAILASKEKYLKTEGAKLANPKTGQKSYWKIVNKFLNKCKVPRVPPLFENNKFITSCLDKATIFNSYFAEQCTPLVTESVLPGLTFHTNNRIDSFQITQQEVNDIISALQPKKANGPDKISVSMIQLCGDQLCAPLKIIFQNILETGIFPDR